MRNRSTIVKEHLSGLGMLLIYCGPDSGADPGFFVGGSAPLRNGVIDVNKLFETLKANTKKAFDKAIAYNMNC